MLNVQNGKVTPCQLLLPIAITVFAFFISVAFQFTQILHDRTAMKDAFAQQAKPLDDTMHLQAQVNALALGTKKLADKGDKAAKTIIDKMKANGIQVNEGPGGAQAPAAPPKAPPPGAMMRQAPPPAAPPSDQP